MVEVAAHQVPETLQQMAPPTVQQRSQVVEMGAIRTQVDLQGLAKHRQYLLVAVAVVQEPDRQGLFTLEAMVRPVG